MNCANRAPKIANATGFYGADSDVSLRNPSLKCGLIQNRIFSAAKPSGRYTDGCLTNRKIPPGGKYVGVRRAQICVMNLAAKDGDCAV